MKLQYTRNKMVLVLVVVMLMAMWSGPATVQAQTTTSYTCFPTCSETDARFMSMAGTGYNTLAGDTVTIQLASPSTESTLEIGIFDGDTGGTWDEGLSIPLEFTLYADPNGDSSGTLIVGQWLGDTMPDNAWHTISLPNTPDAQADSGHYFYYLVIRLTDYSVQTESSFKLRIAGSLSVGASSELIPQAFAFVGQLASAADLYIVYPNYPDTAVTTYDGSWDFYFMIPPGTDTVDIWDGDMDFGSSDLVDNDTDDLDTPNDVLPSWAAGTAATFEGIAVGVGGATGAPPDDSFSLLRGRSPSIVFDVVAPDSQTFHDHNPSGNLEWEQFSIDTAPYDPALMDYHIDDIPTGIWQVRMDGLDLHNLNAWRFPGPAIGVDENGDPVEPLYPYLVGDTVWYDSNQDGVQDAGEPGIAGVIINLIDADGNVIATTTTDADGYYSFEVGNGTYTVEVAAENFATGGALEGMTSTSGGDTIVDTVAGSSVLTYDFGYFNPGSISDQVWFDSDGDGFYEPEDGEVGIEGVKVYLKADPDGDGILNLIATTWTNANGQYIFEDLPSGEYKVVISSINFEPGYPLEGLVPTTDRSSVQDDDVNRANWWTVILINGEDYMWADFGFTLPGSISDQVWLDSDGDGFYEPEDGEVGIEGVKVYLKADPDGDGVLNLIATTWTNANGQYIFENLLSGEYTVVISSYNFEPGYPLEGLVPTTDRSSVQDDDVNRANWWTVVLSNGEDYMWADFGFTLPGSISDQVWLDSDGDGFYEPADGESGIEGVKVYLKADPDGDGVLNLIAMTWTNANGQYIFENLLSGEYTVVISSYNFEPGYPLEGLVWSADQHEAEVDGANRMDYWGVTLAMGEDYTWADFGFHSLNIGGAGCTPSYWKQRQHLDSWVFYKPTDMYDAVFGAPYFVDLLRALSKGGDGEQALGRHATAALLNATALGTDYLYSESEIITMVQDAYLTGDFEGTKDLFEVQNEMGCPLN